MGMVLLLVLVYLAMILFEVPGLIRKKYWRELVAFSVLLLLAFTLSLLQVLGVKIPNPNEAITTLVQAVFTGK